MTDTDNISIVDSVSNDDSSSNPPLKFNKLKSQNRHVTFYTKVITTDQGLRAKDKTELIEYHTDDNLHASKFPRSVQNLPPGKIIILPESNVRNYLKGVIELKRIMSDV